MYFTWHPAYLHVACLSQCLESTRKLLRMDRSLTHSLTHSLRSWTARPFSSTPSSMNMNAVGTLTRTPCDAGVRKLHHHTWGLWSPRLLLLYRARLSARLLGDLGGGGALSPAFTTLRCAELRCAAHCREPLTWNELALRLLCPVCTSS